MASSTSRFTVLSTLMMLLFNYGSADATDISTSQAEVIDRCALIKASVKDAGFADTVSVICDDESAYLRSNSYPDHELMTGIVNTNEQVPVPAVDFVAPVPLQPIPGESPVTRDSSLAVAVNGVPIFDYTGGGELSIEDLHHHQTQHDTLLTQQLDNCGGHAGRGDDYHYHVSPTCMIAAMDNAGDSAIIGWAFDGFPLYGNNNPDGTPIEEQTLDVCNGQADDTYGYRYHTSTKAPYIIQCLMGEVADLKNLPRIPPLRPAAGNTPLAPGRPPRGGVDNLTFTQTAAGGGSLDYSYEGNDYYIRLSPSNNPHCYNMETRTVTNNGQIRTGEYCR